MGERNFAATKTITKFTHGFHEVIVNEIERLVNVDNIFHRERNRILVLVSETIFIEGAFRLLFVAIFDFFANSFFNGHVIVRTFLFFHNTTARFSNGFQLFEGIHIAVKNNFFTEFVIVRINRLNWNEVVGVYNCGIEATLVTFIEENGSENHTHVRFFRKTIGEVTDTNRSHDFRVNSFNRLE